MADEINVTSLIRIQSGNLEYQSTPTQFDADLTTAVGPFPGATLVSPYGTNVDLSAFDTPGWVWIQNLDDTNYVELGIWDEQTLTFYPLFKIRPGKLMIAEFSENLLQEYGTGTGTGTKDYSMANQFRMRAYNQPCWVRVDAFEGSGDL